MPWHLRLVSLMSCRAPLLREVLRVRAPTELTAGAHARPDGHVDPFEDEEVKVTFAEVLQEGVVNLLSASKCSMIYGTSDITNRTVCAMSKSGIDTCYGDSGGPLFSKPPEDDPGQPPLLLGVVSWGTGYVRHTFGWPTVRTTGPALWTHPQQRQTHACAARCAGLCAGSGRTAGRWRTRRRVAAGLPPAPLPASQPLTCPPLVPPVRTHTARRCPSANLPYCGRTGAPSKTTRGCTRPWARTRCGSTPTSTGRHLVRRRSSGCLRRRRREQACPPSPTFAEETRAFSVLPQLPSIECRISCRWRCVKPCARV